MPSFVGLVLERSSGSEGERKPRKVHLNNQLRIVIFPRLEEVKRFYICTKAQGVSRNLTIQHYSTPSVPELKLLWLKINLSLLQRLTGKLVILVPLKASLPYESSDEGVDCDVCQQTVPIRQWAHHIDRCTEQAFRTSKRKTY
ncbi:hypothetical protein GHT06_009013 [Daphnia sinensis]|uniref:Uncharacterized protein n=1 Tax=Daphnia sinensis TaxID=1820382 RepID=A0AAD5Q390_9CRUS|nr:hypothetical protein GHT06_009013 [Daphnia sinensis]